MYRKLTVIACILWLAGLAAFIVGLNITDNTGKWLMTVGQIAFLIGLALEGIMFARRRKIQIVEDKPEEEPENQKPEEQ